MKQFIILYHNNFRGEGPRGDLSAIVRTDNSREEAVAWAATQPFIGELIGIAQGLSGQRFQSIETVNVPEYKVSNFNFVKRNKKAGS